MNRNVNGLNDWTHDLLLPMLLFAATGGMTWAVRGCVGFGASSGCIFAGVTLGTVWWYVARDSTGVQSRRYSSGWIVLAMTVMFGVAGNRGWMQWPQFFNSMLYTNYGAGEYVPISRAHGFLWLFLAGVPWAGLGACGLAWCASGRRTTPWQWMLRLGCGMGIAYFLGVVLYARHPQVFLPLYDSLKDKYQDLENNPSLWKLVRDNREAMVQMGLYLGFLLFEVIRRDWKNTVLITTVGLLNGVGWALLQNWMWAARMWPGVMFNWWRAWESSGGVSIGIAYGVAYFLVNRRMEDDKCADKARGVAPSVPDFRWLSAFIATVLLVGVASLEVLPAWYSGFLSVFAVGFGAAYFMRARKAVGESDIAMWSSQGPNMERWALHTGLVLGLGLSVKNGLKGCMSLHTGRENMQHWNEVFLGIIGPLMILGLMGVSVWILCRPRAAGPRDDAFPRAYGLVWLVLLVQYTLAVLISAPLSDWNEAVFAIYYLLLFFIAAVIIHHFHVLKEYLEKPRGDRGAGMDCQAP